MGESPTMSDLALPRGERPAVAGIAARVAQRSFLLLVAALPCSTYLASSVPASVAPAVPALVATACLLALLGLGAARALGGARPSLRWVDFIPLGALLAAALVSLAGARERALGATECADFALFLGVYVLARALRGLPHIRTSALSSILLGYAVVVALGCMSLLAGALGAPATFSIRRISLVALAVPYPTALNAYVVLVLPLVVACAKRATWRVDRVAYSLLAVAGCCLLVETSPRTALVLFAGGGLLLLFVLWGRRAGLAGTAVAAVALAAVGILLKGASGARVVSLLTGTDGAHAGRLALWQGTIATFLRHLLFGVGPGNLQLGPGGAAIGSAALPAVSGAQSAYLDVLGSLGLAGAAVATVCLGGAMRRAWRAMRARGAWPDRSWHDGLFVGLCALLLDGIVHPVFASVAVGATLCALIGLAGDAPAPLALRRDARSRASGRPGRATRPLAEEMPILPVASLRPPGQASRPLGGHAAQGGSGGRVRARIVFLLNSPGVGGAELHTIHLADELQRQGARVLVVCPAGALAVPLLARREVPYRELELGMNAGRWRGVLGTAALLNPLSRRRFMVQVEGIVREEPTILVCPFPREQVLAARNHKRLDCPVIWIFHAPAHYLAHRLLLRPQLAREAYAADAILAVTSGLADVLGAQGLPRDRIRIVPNAVPERDRAASEDGRQGLRLPDADGGPLIGVACRLVKKKGVQYLIAAMPRVLQRYPAAKLVIAGSGRYAGALRRQVTRLGLRDHVQFLGYLATPGPLFRRLRVYVCPSVDPGEVLPTAVLEAAAAGVPVVASAIASMGDAVVAGRTGLLTRPGDPALLAGAILALLGDPVWARSLGEGGQALVRSHYTMDGAARRFAHLLEGVEARRAADAPEPSPSGVVRAVQRPALLGSTGLLLASKVLSALATAWWTILAARALLPSSYGDLMLCVGLVDLTSSVADAGVTLVATPEFARAGREEIRRLAGTLLHLKLGLGLVAAGVVLGAVRLLPFGTDARTLMVILCPSLPFTSLASLGLLFRARLSLRYVVGVAAIVAVLGSGAALEAYRLAANPLVFAEIRLGTAVASGTLTLALVFWYFRPRLVPRWAAIWRLLVTAVPLGIATVLSILYYRLDVPMLALLAGSTQVAIYTSAYRILDVITLLPASAAAIALPILASIGPRRRKHLAEFAQQYLELALACGLFIALVLVFFGRPLLVTLYGERYVVAVPVLQGLAWAGAATFVTNVFIPLAVALERRRAILLASALGVVVNLALNFALIPRLGAIGPAYATLVTEVAVTLPLAWVTARDLKWRPKWRTLSALCLATGVALVADRALIAYHWPAWGAGGLAIVAWVAAIVAVTPRWVADLVRPGRLRGVRDLRGVVNLLEREQGARVSADSRSGFEGGRPPDAGSTPA